MTDEQYYENKENWGSFITLENIIDNIMLTAGHDSYFKNVERYQLSIYAKQGLKKLNLDVGGNVTTMAVELQPTRIIPYPRYMLNWHRVSVLNECGKLEELNVNNTPDTVHYLQDNNGVFLYDNRATITETQVIPPDIEHYLYDNNGNILYDNDGNILTDNDFDETIGGTVETTTVLDEGGDVLTSDESIEIGKCIKLECVKSEKKESWVKDKGNHFVFSDDLVGKIIVIEYTISSLTSVKDCDIKISNALELVLDNYIRYNALRDMRNVPNVVWREYYQTYKVEKRRAKSLMAKKLSLIQILSAVSKRF